MSNLLSTMEGYKLQYGKVNKKTKERSGLAPRTIRSHKNLIVSALNPAIIDGIITTNPVHLFFLKWDGHQKKFNIDWLMQIITQHEYLHAFEQ